MLPVLMADGAIEWFAWGKPFAEDGKEPSGGWARHESLAEGKWKRWKPKPVKIPVTAFMERSPSKEAVWFPVDSSLVIQGAAIRLPNTVMVEERGSEIVRVYVVTIQAAGEVAKVHDRMPRLIKTEAC